MSIEEGIETHTFQSDEFAQSPAPAGIVNFTLGQPGPKILSLPHFTQAFEMAFLKVQRDPTILAYADALGHREFRTALASWLTRRYGFPVAATDLIMTNGNTHGMDFVIRQLISFHVAKVGAGEAGSSTGGADAAPQRAFVAMDDPTYFLAGGVVKRYVNMANFNGRRQEPSSQDQPLLTLRMCETSNETGFNVDAFESWLIEIYGKGQTLIALYLIPLFHNPTGSSLSKANALRLVTLAQRFNFYILSDEPYPFLNFSEDPTDAAAVVSLAAIEHELLACNPETSEGAAAAASALGRKRVVAMGSFSKIFAPGLRLGWLHADPKFIENGLVPDPILDSGGGVNPVAGAVVRCMLDGSNESPPAPHSLDNYLAALVPELRSRNAALCAALHARFGKDIVFIEPTGGYFLWLRFVTQVEGFSGASFKAFVMADFDKYKVSFLPGPACRAGAGDSADEELSPTAADLSMCIRLSFAFYEAEELVEGVRRLRVAYDAFLESLVAA